MKSFLLFTIMIAILGFYGCGGIEVKTTDSQGVTTTTIDLSKGDLAVATHNDLVGAAAVATKNGYPEVAAWYGAQDTVLTATEGQISACLNAQKALLPAAPVIPAGAGPITRAEILREAVDTAVAVPARVRVLCHLPPLIVMPKP